VHQPKSSEEISFIAAADAWPKILIGKIEDM